MIIQPIAPQRFEFIRDRTMAILMSEFEQQFILTGDYSLQLNFFVERSNSLDEDELDAIIVSLAHGDYSNKNQGSVDGAYMYHIDHYTKSKSSLGIAGDTAAQIKLQKFMGITRAILEDPVYKTLGVVPPFIMGSWVSEFDIAPPKPQDVQNVAMGRIVFNVRANETSNLIVPTLIKGYNTQIKINGTGKGYFYQGENY